ncbi:MAG: MMPL family transporter [Myxococcales bacterium]|nr:MMPL family transporter [Myxococcales bacterium]
MRILSVVVTRFPWLFIVLFLGITGAFATQLVHVQIDPEVKNQLPDDMPARLDTSTIESHFGGSEMVLVVVQAPDVLDEGVLERLHGISEGLEELDFVDRVLSPFTLTRIEGNEHGEMVVQPAIDLDALPSTARERDALAESLKRNELVYGNVVAPDFSAISAIAMLGTEATDAITMESVAAVIEANPGPGEVEIGGNPDVRTHLSQDIRGDFRRFLPVGLGIVLGFLFVCFRQLRGVILPFSVVVMSVIVAMALIPLLGWKIQMVTVTLPVILLAVANDYGIHLMARYQEENVPGKQRDKGRLARVVLLDLGPPVAAAGITTMAGLLCLTTHIVVPGRQLGVLAAAGVGFALLCSLFFIPAVLAVMPVPKPLASLADESGPRGLERLLERVARMVAGNPWRVIAAVALFSLGSATGFAWLTVDTNPVNYYAADAPVAQTTSLLNEAFGGSTELSVLFEGDILDPDMMARIDALERDLAASEDVGFTSSIAGVVRMMAEAAGGEAERLPDERNEISQLFMLYSMGGDPEDFERMVDFEYEHALLTARINTLSTQRTSAVVDLAKSTVGEDGNVVVGGFGAVFADLVDAVVEGQVVSLALSLLLVFVLVAITFRSPGAGLYAVVPLLMAIPVLFGLMGHLSIELNVVTAMLSSIMVGVGVDYTLHFLWRYRAERREGLEPVEAVVRTLTTAGRGIVFNALSVIVGFSVLLISNFLPVQFFGFLVVVSIGACLVGALVLLPSMVLVFRPEFLEP